MRRLLTARAALLAALGLMCLNYAGTSRWAAVPGSLHGAKQPVFLATLIVTIVLAVIPWPRERSPMGPLARVIGWTAVGSLCIFFFIWFPPRSWTQIPLLDNWPARYLSTLQGIDLLRRGTVTGWHWHYLGGYHLSSDITQSLTVLSLVPILLLGPAPGFHLLHLVLFLAPPLLVMWDLSSEDRETRYLALGVTTLGTASLSYILLRSGDTNSLAGLACLTLALGASQAAARAPRWGGPLLVCALVLLVYAHIGFFLYAVLFLVIDAWFHRDARRLGRASVALGCAFIAGMPQYWESWRYPRFFLANNVVVDPDATFAWSSVLRNVFYNVELLWLPGRWRNDFVGLATVCLPISAFVAWRVRSRAGFYAWIAFATMLLLRLNTGEFGYVFERPIYVLAVCMGPVLAVFLSRFVTRRGVVIAVVALVAAYLQILVFRVPHVPTPRDAGPELADRVSAVEGALVLVENTPHRDMDIDPESITEPAPLGAHVEQVLGAATGRRLYAGFWDGWQWTPFRDQVLAGGAFRGRAIGTVPVDDVTAELRTWGVRHLLIWSRASVAYFSSQRGLFAERWSSGIWHDFEYLDADTRDVWMGVGRGRLAAFDPLSARIDLTDVQQRTPVVVRTNYHPSWTAIVAGTNEAVPLRSHNGQLAFDAPRAGSYSVALVYPRRRWLSLLALAVVVLGSVVLSRDLTWVRSPDGRRK